MFDINLIHSPISSLEGYGCPTGAQIVRDLAAELREMRERIIQYGSHYEGCLEGEHCKCGWTQLRKQLDAARSAEEKP